MTKVREHLRVRLRTTAAYRAPWGTGLLTLFPRRKPWRSV